MEELKKEFEQVFNYKIGSAKDDWDSIIQVDAEGLWKWIESIVSRVGLPVILPKPCPECEQIADKLKTLIKQLCNDMVVMYAPEEVGKKAVKEMSKRVRENHSTLVYIDHREKTALQLIDQLIASNCKA